MDDKEIIKQLKEALEAANEHLEYCGWGDTWEASCAHDSGLPVKIENAIEAAKQHR